jgi:hypothetical protein
VSQPGDTCAVPCFVGLHPKKASLKWSFLTYLWALSIVKQADLIAGREDRGGSRVAEMQIAMRLAGEFQRASKE